MPAAPDAAPVLVELAEWDEITPNADPRLLGITFKHDIAAQRLADILRPLVDVRPGYEGLCVATSSYVGRIDIGALRVSIRPKLAAEPLARLLRYAYGLRDIDMLGESRAPTVRDGLHDLLIAILANEVEELLHRGLSRQYVRREDLPDSPRGRIQVSEIAKRGGILEARLPCVYFDRDADWHLNQVLRAGLTEASSLTQDRELRRRLHRLQRMFGEVGQRSALNDADLRRAEEGLSRLTAAYSPALTIIRLLCDGQGVAFRGEQQNRIPGFLFNMNLFFQRLLSRFLQDNLVGQRVEDERGIRNVFAYAKDGNPRRRTNPAPRPDFALYSGSTLRAFLDAKYRDIWTKNLPAEWLYQLSVYAQSSPSQVSVILYATVDSQARDEHITVSSPIPWSVGKRASVIVRPVLLPYLAYLVTPSQAARLAKERRAFVERLVSLRPDSAFATETGKSLIAA
jgi:5-methylcytosine-specific restriction enzyme subunit McrC